MLIGIDGMGFQFHDRIAGQRKYALEPGCRRQRRQAEQMVDEKMAIGQPAVDCFAIQTVRQTFLSRLKGMVSPDECTRRQQFIKQHVRTKMEVMMTVDPLRISSVEPAKFVDLSRHHILERARETGMVKNSGQRMP